MYKYKTQIKGRSKEITELRNKVSYLFLRIIIDEEK